MNEDNNIPSLPEHQMPPEFLRGDRWFEVDVGPYLLDFTKSYQSPQYTLSWRGIPFAPLGGIHAITGQAGNGKTMTIAQFMAAILSGEFGELRYELSESHPDPTVLYIDTEMEEANTIAVKNRVMTMCGRGISETWEQFRVIMLREVPEVIIDEKTKITSAEMRWRMTLKAIYDFKPTVVFIDGLLDVVADFNDNKMCQELIYKCMQTASHYGISIWCIVHQNPGGEKLVGHLGSFVERKVTDVIQTKKEKKDDSVTFEVKQKKARGRDFPDWKFQVLPVGGWGMPEQIVEDKPKSKVEFTTDDLKQWIGLYQNEVEWPATLTDIRTKIFKEKVRITNNDILQECIRMSKNARLIIEQPSNEREDDQKHPKYYINGELIEVHLPF